MVLPQLHLPQLNLTKLKLKYLKKLALMREKKNNAVEKIFALLVRLFSSLAQVCFKNTVVYKFHLCSTKKQTNNKMYCFMKLIVKPSNLVAQNIIHEKKIAKTAQVIRKNTTIVSSIFIFGLTHRKEKN